MSFFDDGEEETAVRRSPRAAPRPRRAQQTAQGVDQQTLMVRRLIAGGVGLVLVIVIALTISSCLKSQETQGLKDYNRQVGTLAEEAGTQVAQPLFAALAGASGKSAIDVGVQIGQLRSAAQALAARAQRLSTPGAMTSAQRALLLAFDLRVEAIAKIAEILPTALGSKSKQASAQLSGDMEILLASDVIYSQRVAPLIEQALSGGGVQGASTAPSRFLANTGWLDPETTYSRITGQATGTQASQAVTGNHGSALKLVSVGTNTLAGEPTINHISGGANPTFTVQVENSGEFPETNVKANLTITVAGKQYKASHTIEKTEPGKTLNVEIPITGIPLGEAAKIEVGIAGVPGENDLENNKGTFLALFSA